MSYSKISFAQVKQTIDFILGLEMPDKLSLCPDNIHKLCEQGNIRIEWTKIDWWTSFEYGHLDVSDKQFFDLLFVGLSSCASKLIMVTDECFKDKSAYVTTLEGFLDFADHTYSDIHNMSPFQPQDVIFLLPEEKYIIMLHHEGYFTQIKTHNNH